MRRRLLILLACTVLLIPSGCGIIYTHITTPLDIDMRSTQAGEVADSGDIKHLQIYYAGFQWDSNAVGTIAKRHGMEKVYYADLEQLRILFGIWNQYTAHLYGK